MKSRRGRWWFALVLGAAWTGAVSGEEPVITSFPGNGQLAWTNPVNTNALYRVEWAAQAGGPWFRNFDNIGSVDGHSATGFAVAVPMFYRVVMATNPPPAGMVWIEAGDVVLGQEGVATPVHTNSISGFWIDEMEISIDRWREVHDWALTNGYAFEHAGSAFTNRHPVADVNWYDCVKWCNARSEKEGLSPRYWFASNSFLVVYQTGIQSNLSWRGSGYRLPTEAEWEKAARGGRQGRLFPWGDTITHAWANYYAVTTNAYAYDANPAAGWHPDFAVNFGAAGRTSPVGSFPANGYGLHDVAGNVWEWCWDWWDSYSADYASDPTGPTNGTQRVKRGGDYNNLAGHGGLGPFHARVASRAAVAPGSSLAGFRCVRSP